MRLEERARSIQVCSDLLPQGGAFVAFENIRPFTAAGFEIGKRGWGRFWVLNGKTPTEIGHLQSRLDVEFLPITVEEHLDLLRRTGLSAAELFWRSNMQAGFYAIK